MSERLLGRAAEDIAEGDTGTVVLDRPSDGGDAGFGDWFTLKGPKRWRCGCGASSFYVAEADRPHRILVWPSEDDPNLLRTAREIEESGGFKADVLAYERAMGAAVSYYKATPS